MTRCIYLPDGTKLEEQFSERIYTCLEWYESRGRLDSVHPDQLEKLCVEDAALLATLKFHVSIHSEVFSFEIQQASNN